MDTQATAQVLLGLGESSPTPKERTAAFVSDFLGIQAPVVPVALKKRPKTLFSQTEVDDLLDFVTSFQNEERTDPRPRDIEKAMRERGHTRSACDWRRKLQQLRHPNRMSVKSFLSSQECQEQLFKAVVKHGNEWTKLAADPEFPLFTGVPPRQLNNLWQALYLKKEPVVGVPKTRKRRSDPDDEENPPKRSVVPETRKDPDETETDDDENHSKSLVVPETRKDTEEAEIDMEDFPKRQQELSDQPCSLDVVSQVSQFILPELARIVSEYTTFFTADQWTVVHNFIGWLVGNVHSRDIGPNIFEQDFKLLGALLKALANAVDEAKIVAALSEGLDMFFGSGQVPERFRNPTPQQYGGFFPSDIPSETSFDLKANLEKYLVRSRYYTSSFFNEFIDSLIEKLFDDLECFGYNL